MWGLLVLVVVFLFSCDCGLLLSTSTSWVAFLLRFLHVIELFRCQYGPTPIGGNCFLLCFCANLKRTLKYVDHLRLSDLSNFLGFLVFRCVNYECMFS